MTKNLLIILALLLTTSCFGKTNQGASNKQITNNQSTNQVYQVTFVELGSDRCVPCKMMQPVMQDIRTNYSNQVRVVFYDVWTEEGKPYAVTYKIRVIPTQVFLDKDGKEFYRHEGYFPKEELMEVLIKQGVK